MRILYIITQSSWGGAQKYVFTLASALAKNPELEVTVAGGQESIGELRDKLAALKIDFIPLKNLVREISFFTDCKAVWEIKKLIEEKKPDIVHLNSTKAGVVGSLAARLSRHRAKVIYTVHGWVFNEDLKPLTKSIYFWIEKITAGCKDRFICISNFDRQIGLKKKITTPSKMSVIYNGVEVESLNFLSKEEAVKKLLNDYTLDDKIIIGAIANFYPNKGLNYLIEAVNLLITSYQLPVTLIIIGDGKLRQELTKQISELNLGKNVMLAGQIKNAASYLKAMDIAVISSLKEGTPYFILEAMAAGLPIVATNVGGIPEMIDDGKTGFLVPPKDAMILAHKLKLLIQDQNLCRQMGQAGLNKVKKDFSQEKMLSETLAAYQT